MAAEVAEGLVVFPEAMRENLRADNGLIMAEAYMMRLAPSLGHKQAHDVVYEAAVKSRQKDRPLEETLEEFVSGEGWAELKGEMPLAPESYVGRPDVVCDAALETWRRGPYA